MSTNTAVTKNGIDSVESSEDLPCGVGRLGTDSQEGTHYFYGMPHWKVWVFVNDELVHEQDIKPGQVKEWVEFIAEQKGWEENLYEQPLAEMFAEVIIRKEGE